MQTVALVRQAFHGDQFLAVQRRQKLYARVDGTQGQVVAISIRLGQYDGAGAAVTLCAPLLGALAAQVFAQELQHGARRIDIVDGDNFAVEHKSNR